MSASLRVTAQLTAQWPRSGWQSAAAVLFCQPVLTQLKLWSGLLRLSSVLEFELKNVSGVRIGSERGLQSGHNTRSSLKAFPHRSFTESTIEATNRSIIVSPLLLCCLNSGFCSDRHLNWAQVVTTIPIASTHSLLSYTTCV